VVGHLLCLRPTVATNPAVSSLLALLATWDFDHAPPVVDPLAPEVGDLARSKAQPTADENDKGRLFCIRVTEGSRPFEQ
jgi:hypothetical protein